MTEENMNKALDALDRLGRKEGDYEEFFKKNPDKKEEFLIRWKPKLDSEEYIELRCGFIEECPPERSTGPKRGCPKRRLRRRPRY